MLYEADNSCTAQTRIWQVLFNNIHPALHTWYSGFTNTYHGNLLEITAPFFKGHACSQVTTALFAHCCSQQIYLLTLIFQTHFSSSFICQSKLKCRTLQQQDVKRRQGTECTFRKFFPYIRNNSYENLKKTPQITWSSWGNSCRQHPIYYYYYCYYYYFYYMTYSSIILWCII